MLGEKIIIKTPTAGKSDGFGDNPTTVWVESEVENVLIAPNTGVAGTRDMPMGVHAQGDYLRLTAHFPKTFTASLRNCFVVIDGTEYAVEGDPRPFMEDLTPGEWNRPVPLKLAEGG